MVGEVDTNEMVSELRLFFNAKNNHQMDKSRNNNSVRKRNTKDEITNQKGTRMVKTGQH